MKISKKISAVVGVFTLICIGLVIVSAKGLRQTQRTEVFLTESIQQSIEVDNRVVNNSKGVTDFVYIDKKSAYCPSINCAYTHEFFLHNTHSARAIGVKYESVDWRGEHISTYKTVVEARYKENIGNNYDKTSYRILSAWYAD
jgi:hypothetical protein